MPHTRFLLAPMALVAASMTFTAVHAAPTALDGPTWTATGAAGLIGASATVPLSPTGNQQFGFVTTADSAAYNVSPLLLKTDGKGNEVANNGTKIVSGSFSALASTSLTLHFNYVSTDGRGYDDYAWARLVNAGTDTTAAWLYTARSTNSARGNVVPGDVLSRQLDNKLPDELDATLNNGNSVGFNVSSTVWQPLGGFSGSCWNDANTCGPSGWIRSDYTFAQSGNYYLEFGVVNWGDTLFDSALAFDFSGLQSDRFPGLAVVTSVPEPQTYAMMAAGLVLLGAMAKRRHATRG